MKNNMYLLIDKNSNYNLNQKLVRKCVILLRKKRNLSERERQELMLKLFIACSNIIMKAINNFFHLTKNYDKLKVIHTKEDITIECYFGLHRCVLNMKMKDFKKFHFYLNSALNKIVYRIYERNYKKHNQIVDNSEQNELWVQTAAKYLHHIDFTDLDVVNMDLNEIEYGIMVMKVEGQRFQEFLKSNKISHNQYTENLETLKQKILKIYDK